MKNISFTKGFRFFQTSIKHYFNINHKINNLKLKVKNIDII